MWQVDGNVVLLRLLTREFGVLKWLYREPNLFDIIFQFADAFFEHSGQDTAFKFLLGRQVDCEGDDVANEDLLERLGLNEFDVTLQHIIVLSLSATVLFLGLRELFENGPDGFFGQIFELSFAEDINGLCDCAWKSMHGNERVKIYMRFHQFLLLGFGLDVLELVLKTRLHGDPDEGGQKTLEVFDSFLASFFFCLKRECIISLLIGNASQDVFIQKVIQAVRSFPSQSRRILFQGCLLILLHVLSLGQNIQVSCSFTLAIGHSLIIDLVGNQRLGGSYGLEHSKIFGQLHFSLHVTHILKGHVVFDLAVLFFESVDFLRELISS